MAVNLLQLPCLGRPFQLGMLYDCYTDRLISEVRLLDIVKLEKYQSCIANFTTNCDILDNDSLNEKYSYLGITGDSKLSCLVGLIKVSGCARFLKDISSLQQVRVCFKYCSNSKYKELLVDQLKNVPCIHTCSSTPATHIVTGISYGADAIFVFDYTLQENEKRQDIIEFMKDAVEKLPYLYIDDNDNIKFNLKVLNKDKTDKICCKLYTDVHVGINPTTFQDAIRAYKLIAEQSSNSENIVPKSLWLYPLNNEDCNNYLEISSKSINALLSLMEYLTMLELKISDLKKVDTSVTFIIFQKELNMFANSIANYKMIVLQEVKVLVPKIRSKKKSESEIVTLLQTYENSILSSKKLTQWLETKKKEIDTMKNLLRNVQEIKYAFSEDTLDEALNDITFDYIICFEFNVCGEHNEYLEQLSAFIQSKTCKNVHFPTKPWYKDHKIKGKIKEQLRKFKIFYEANKENVLIKFLVTHNPSEQQMEGATIRLYEDGLDQIFNPPERCNKPKLITESSNSLEIKWDQPKDGEIKNYTVYYSKDKGESFDLWMKHTTTGTNTSVTITNLQPDTAYYFKVCANCKVGSCEISEPSEAFKTKSSISNAVAEFKTLGKLVKPGNPSIFEIPLTLVYEGTGAEGHIVNAEEDQDTTLYEQHLSIQTDDIKITKYVVGQNKTFYTEGSEKVLMIVGATGAGKTTLINSMINYLFGVNFEDDFRLQLISENSGKSQAHSQTRGITSYTIYKMTGFELQYPLTIVDTPGYGDTEGLMRDKIITNQIKTFFSQSGDHGIDHLDGVGFVVQSALARLTKTQEYIFESILALFGKDVRKNIFIMVTFADAQRPPVLNAIDKAMISYDTYYTFNNPAIFADKTINKLFWEMGNKSFEAFFIKFSQSQDVSLKCTREVLYQRKKLDVFVHAIHRKIELGVAIIEQLEREKRVMYVHQAKIDANENFTFTIPMTKQRQIHVKKGTYAMNCVNCNFTCHYPCSATDDEKFKCWAMENPGNKTTKCRTCPGNCSWVHHFNNGYKFELYTTTETRTSDVLKKNYLEGKEDKKKAEAMVNNIKKHITDTRQDVKKKMKTVQGCLAKLNEIALRTNPLTEENNLEMLIISEEDERRAGYLGRIKFYQEALQEAQIVSIAKGKKTNNPTRTKYERVMDPKVSE